MKHFRIVILAPFLFMLARLGHADIVAPNPHCYVTGTVRSKGVQEKFRRNNPTEYKKTTYEARFVEIELISIRLAAKDEVSFGWTSGSSEGCEIQDHPGAIYPKLKRFDFSGSEEEFSQIKVGEVVTGVAQASGDEYGAGHFFELRM